MQESIANQKNHGHASMPGSPIRTSFHDTNGRNAQSDGQYYFYSPTPAPETVAIRDKPSRTKAACCWGCLAALCLCFASEECC
ncbi:hypothetical protein VTP01DRAFT_2595, partial [Rhizomucor pusillus]|uniref:uncharacterized protein n=1 Tax=Rhizomucor pusillus TaxID=4840 RepID=UPI0037431C7A